MLGSQAVVQELVSENTFSSSKRKKKKKCFEYLFLEIPLFKLLSLQNTFSLIALYKFLPCSSYCTKKNQCVSQSVSYFNLLLKKKKIHIQLTLSFKLKNIILVS